LLGCKTDDILSKQQLEDILFEMHLSDGIIHALTDKNQIQNADSIFRYKNIFEKYKCSRDKFEKSMRVYSGKKETIDKIYENIKKRFETKLKNLERKTFSDITKNIIDKLHASIKDALSSVKKYFENAENIENVVEKLLNFHEDISPETETDSVKSERNFEKIN
jgi:hypothetical protein